MLGCIFLTITCRNNCLSIVYVLHRERSMYIYNYSLTVCGECRQASTAVATPITRSGGTSDPILPVRGINIDITAMSSCTVSIKGRPVLSKQHRVYASPYKERSRPFVSSETMRVSRRKVLNMKGMISSISGKRAEQSPRAVIERRRNEVRSCAARNDAFSMATRGIPRFCVVCVCVCVGVCVCV